MYDKREKKNRTKQFRMNESHLISLGRSQVGVDKIRIYTIFDKQVC